MKKAKTKRKATTSARPARKPSKTNGRAPLDVISIRTNGVMELEPHLLSMQTSSAIARSLKRSADRSLRLDATPFHSAMGVLNGLISHVELLKARLEASKKDLRRLYGESGDDKPVIPHEPTPPQEFAKRRNGGKHPVAAPKNDKPADNRPRSRPNKLV